MIQHFLATDAPVTGGGLYIPLVGQNNGFTISNVLGTLGLGLVQGSQANQRIGAKISPTRLNLKFFVKSATYDANHNFTQVPFEFHILLWKKKNNPDGDPNSILFDTNKSETYIDGSSDRSMLQWNTHDYVIKKHIVRRLKPPVVQVNSTNTHINDTYGSSSNPFFVRVGCNVKVKSNLLYPHGPNEDTPTNDWFALSCYVVNGSGQPIGVNQSRAFFSCLATMHYKDA
jgi:hypothetical protein